MSLPKSSLRRRLGLGLLLLACCTTRSYGQATPPFTRTVNDMEQVALGSTLLGDLDNDGDADFLITGIASYSNDRQALIAATYRMDGYRTVPRPQQTPLLGVTTGLSQSLGGIGAAYSAAAWTDLNHDGLLDVLLSGSTTRTPPYLAQSTLFLNTGTDGTRLQATPTDLPATYGGALAWGDYDNDGDADLLLAGNTAGGYATFLFRNDSRPSGAPGLPGVLAFTEVPAGLPGVGYGDGGFVDYDGDGDLDLWLTGASDAGFLTELYRNDGGAFTPLQAGFQGLGFSTGAWGDYDNDGDPDFLLSGALLDLHIAHGVTRLYRNDGGTFTEVDAGLPGLFSARSSWGDYDGDGTLDLFLTGLEAMLQEEKRMWFFRGAGPDRFEAVEGLIVSGIAMGDFAAGDLDGDGDLDLFTTGDVRGAQTLPYRNEYDHGNQPPAPPADLQAAAQAGAVTLRWAAASDAETPAAGLTYNLRVGTTPGGVDILPPLAHPVDGTRRVAAPGNVWHNTRWTLRGLPPGTYYWSVQAVDPGYVGSAFAPEGTFTIPATAPNSL